MNHEAIVLRNYEMLSQNFLSRATVPARYTLIERGALPESAPDRPQLLRDRERWQTLAAVGRVAATVLEFGQSELIGTIGMAE